MGEAEALGEGLGGEEGVLALAELGVVEVDGEREQVDGDGVGEGGFEELVAGLLVDAEIWGEDSPRRRAEGAAGYAVSEMARDGASLVVMAWARVSQASWEVSPRTSARAWFQASSAKDSGTPAASTRA